MKKEVDNEMAEYELKSCMETLEKAASIKSDKKLMKKLSKHHKTKSKSMAKEFDGIDDDEDESPSSIKEMREKANKKAMAEYE